MGAFIGVLIWLALIVLFIAGTWKAFEKAGEPGWACIVPFYNVYVMCRMAGKPGWWLLLFFVPLVNLIVSIIVLFAIAENFGKGAGFALGLLFLGFIFWPVLGFGDAQYRGVHAA
jgi:uncharacterized membrane protein YhaH (DUF805 family)